MQSEDNPQKPDESTASGGKDIPIECPGNDLAADARVCNHADITKRIARCLDIYSRKHHKEVLRMIDKCMKINRKI